MTNIRVLHTPQEMQEAETLQAQVWVGDPLEVIPVHLLITAAHNGGLVLGAYEGQEMVGVLFGFPGLLTVPDGLHPKHCSHVLGVHPRWRDAGIGYQLKRAQWQLVRQQGIDLITWTYDPLQSRNANLNIARLGAVCNTYQRNVYGTMRDNLNYGMESDRFQVDWWLSTPRTLNRLGENPRPRATLQDYLSAGCQTLYTASHAQGGDLLLPAGEFAPPNGNMLLAEIPSDFQHLKAQDLPLALAWRAFTRQVFETCFAAGYYITDFVYQPGTRPRSFYLLTSGNATLG
jgi:predicted GNAT superfamily acetyltransferase